MTLSTFRLEHLPPDKVLYAALFKDVTNASSLKQRLLSGDTEYEYAFIDATTLISVVHALAAAYRAINDLEHERLRSRNVHSEIVFSLSPNNNIAESFRRFGIGEDTTSVLAMKVSTSPSVTQASVTRHLFSAVEGTAIDFSDDNLRNMTDLARVRKCYKLSEAKKTYTSKKLSGESGFAKEAKAGEVDRDQQAQMRGVETAVLAAIALRGS